MDVVAAGDAEPEIAEQVIASVGVNSQSSPTVPMQQQQEVMENNCFSKEICNECNKKFPPSGESLSSTSYLHVFNAIVA